MIPARTQIEAADPRVSAFVAANAGSGKTATLVQRVARLLLHGARPEAVLCVTYTKAAAAEMRRRLIDVLGDWAIADDEALNGILAEIGEAERGPRALKRARGLFARALDTPGGLAIQTLHGFCEQLLRRFPVEAAVPPGFTVLDDPAAAAIAAAALREVAGLAMKDPEGLVGRAWAHFAVQLKGPMFEGLFDDIAGRRLALASYLERCAEGGGEGRDVWRRCGFDAVSSRAAVERECLEAIRWGQWKRAAERLAASPKITDQKLAAAMGAVTSAGSVGELWPIFHTGKGEPRGRMGTKSVDPAILAWLEEERDRQVKARQRWLAACVAEETCQFLALAGAYIAAYEAAKKERGALDFADLIAHAARLVREREDAVWVLYKLDGGIDHILLDEGQDTAPEQWGLLRALTADFFSGLSSAAHSRTMFAVGDPKQSIFSFQGARPERFAVEAQAFARQALAAGGGFKILPLVESWRSTEEILGFVDKVFEDPEAWPGLLPGTDGLPLRHKATRGPGGGVDLWPLESGETGEEVDVWAPVDAPAEDNPNRRLADRIAADIIERARTGERVGAKKNGEPRPCGYGDMLILVRRRNALFHEILRALKRAGAPVGGADRLTLSEHGAFQDLLALGRFVRFPQDNLTLACLLRGPFCSASEEDLYDLAHAREGSLWAELRRRAGERPAWAEALDFLDWARDLARRRAPFDFYARVLTRLDGEGRSMRQRLLTRLGAEGEHAVDAFLAEVLAAEERGARDLERLIAELACNQIEIKREAEGAGAADGSGEVRVMTVHGAKGLEAPIVYLPDTTSRVQDLGGAILETNDGAFLYAPRGGEDCAVSAQARAARAEAVEREASRLLYVALTRARDRLVVCGVESQAHRFQGSWRDFIERAFAKVHSKTVELADGSEIRRYGSDPVAENAPSEPGRPGPAGPDGTPRLQHLLPAWIDQPAMAEAPAAHARPSADARAFVAAVSPLAEASGLGRWRRGALIHSLLERLPESASDHWRALAERLLAREPGLTGEQRAEIAGAVLRVLAEPSFAPLFGPGSRAEVPMVGEVAGQAVFGRVDRLLVTPSQVLVIDYKTNRPPPKTADDVDPTYVRQMALYAALLRQIHPDRLVRAALLWTDGPTLMPLPDALLGTGLS